ncbi:hypothetical protein V1509DRAFT_217542 [Lipomyces kononenkoae]
MSASTKKNFAASIGRFFEKLAHCVFVPTSGEYVKQSKNSTIVVQAPTAIQQMTIGASMSTDKADTNEHKIENGGQSLPAHDHSDVEKKKRKSQAKFNIKRWFHHITTKSKEKIAITTGSSTEVVVQYCATEKMIDPGSDTVADMSIPVTDTAAPLPDPSYEQELLPDTVAECVLVSDAAASLPSSSYGPEVLTDTVADASIPITDAAAPDPSYGPEVPPADVFIPITDTAGPLHDQPYKLKVPPDTVADMFVPVTDAAVPDPSYAPEVPPADVSISITDIAAPLPDSSCEPELKQQQQQSCTPWVSAQEAKPTAVAAAVAVIAAAIVANATATTTEASEIKWNNDISFMNLLKGSCIPSASTYLPTISNLPVEGEDKTNDKVSRGMHNNNGLHNPPVEDQYRNPEKVSDSTDDDNAMERKGPVMTPESTHEPTMPSANLPVEGGNQTPEKVSDNVDGDKGMRNPPVEDRYKNHEKVSDDNNAIQLKGRSMTPIAALERTMISAKLPAEGQNGTPDSFSGTKADDDCIQNPPKVENDNRISSEKVSDSIDDNNEKQWNVFSTQWKSDWNSDVSFMDLLNRPVTPPVPAQETRTEVTNPPHEDKDRTLEKTTCSVDNHGMHNFPVEDQYKNHEKVSDNIDNNNEKQWNVFSTQWKSEWNSDVSFTDLLNRPVTPPIPAQKPGTAVASPPVAGAIGTPQGTPQKVTDNTDGSQWHSDVLFMELLKQSYKSPVSAQATRTVVANGRVEGETKGARERLCSSDTSTSSEPSTSPTTRSGTSSPASTTATTPIEASDKTTGSERKTTLGRGSVSVSDTVAAKSDIAVSASSQSAPVTRYAPVTVAPEDRTKYISALVQPVKDPESHDTTYLPSSIAGLRTISRIKSVLSSSFGSGTETNESMTDMLSSFPVSIRQLLMSDLNRKDLFRGTCDHANPVGCTNCSDKMDYLKRMRDALAALRCTEVNESNRVAKARDMALQGRWK